MNDLELKSICEGLPGWAHWFVWILVLGFHFGRVHFVKKKLINQFLGSTEEETKEIIMPTEIGKSGVSVDYKDGKAIVSAFDGSVELTVKAAALVNPLLDKVIAKVESGEIDLIKGTDLEKGPVLQVLAALKAEINK